MAAVNYSISEDLKTTFNETFEGRNKSAIIAGLMREAIDRERLDRESREAIARILNRRRNAPVVPDERIQTARRSSRP